LIPDNLQSLHTRIEDHIQSLPTSERCPLHPGGRGYPGALCNRPYDLPKSVVPHPRTREPTSAKNHQ